MEKAIALCPQYSFDVSWEPYFLRPNMPKEGIEKAPNTPDNPRVGARMKQAGASVGIDFTGKCDRCDSILLTVLCVISGGEFVT